MASALALLTAACGSAADEDGGAVELDLIADQPAGADGATLAAAFQTTAEAPAYRAEMAMGMNMTMGDGEFALSFDADPTQPMMFINVDAEGEQHIVVDMGSMMNSLLAPEGMSNAAIEELFGDMTMEMWVSGSVMTLDIAGFGELLSGASAADVFPADVFTVDAGRLGEGIGASDLASAMAGQATPDPRQMADVLGGLLGESDVRGAGFAATVSFLDYATAFGQDPEVLLGSEMGALFDRSGDDSAIDALIAVFESMEVDVSGVIANDAVDRLRFDMDLSAIWDELPAIMEATGETMSASDLAEFRAMAENATFDMTVLLDYDLDPSVEVTVPEGDFVDATDEWISLFGDAFG